MEYAPDDFSEEAMRARYEGVNPRDRLGPAYRKYFDQHGINPERDESIGFSEQEQKWYGWSHRAIYGFGVGSVVDKGHCAYTAPTVDELYDEYLAFFDDIVEGDAPEAIERRAKMRAERAARVTKDYENGCIHIGVEHIYMPMVNSIAGLQAEMAAPGVMGVEAVAFGGNSIKVGRGKWTAQTLEDAKQMARDFAEGVS